MFKKERFDWEWKLNVISRVLTLGSYFQPLHCYVKQLPVSSHVSSMSASCFTYRDYCIWIVRHGGHLTCFMRSGSSFYTGSMSSTLRWWNSNSETLSISTPAESLCSALSSHLCYHYLAPVKVSAVLSWECIGTGLASVGVEENHIWALIAANNHVWTSEKDWAVICLYDVDSQISGSACVCQWKPLCEMYNWLMGLQNPGWQGKVIGWYDFESSCNWLTSEVQLRAARL